MKRFFLFFSISVLVVGVCSGILLTHTADEIAASTLRLHVIANSDSATDQANKLAVRDAVLMEMEALTADCTNKSETMETVRANTDRLASAAARTLAELGCDAPVSVIVTREEYPTRTYEDFALPAGMYDSVQVKIGEAAGQNWWCVLFPPLCMGVAEAKEELLEVGFTPGQVKLITDTEDMDYVVRFKVVEWVRALQGKEA